MKTQDMDDFVKFALEKLDILLLELNKEDFIFEISHDYPDFVMAVSSGREFAKAPHFPGFFVEAFVEIFIAYLFNKNYPNQYLKEDLKEILILLTFRGENPTPNNLYNDSFFDAEKKEDDFLRRKIWYLNYSKKFEERKADKASCPFSKSGLKDLFIETVWNFIEIKFYPLLLKKYSNRDILNWLNVQKWRLSANIF